VKTLTFDQLRAINKARCEESFHPLSIWLPSQWTNAMARECGEACNLTKKIDRLLVQKQEWNKLVDRDMVDLENRLAEEIADAVIYADLALARIGRSLGDAVRKKFNEKSDEIGSALKL
jgi:NTP pyrophosphatase (non-canonical NTP hydrolase)